MKDKAKIYLKLFLALFIILSIPKALSLKFQEKSIALVTTFFKPNRHIEKDEEVQRLKIENVQLKSKLQELQKIIFHKESLISSIQYVKEEEKRQGKNHSLELKERLNFQLKAIPAHVIFRSPSSWNSSLWIDVGQKDNEKLGFTVVALESPVVLGDAVVGVIDFVGSMQSRVRLITDSGLTPAVRSSRGNIEKQQLLDRVNLLIKHLSYSFEAVSEKGKKHAIKSLQHLKKEIKENSNNQTWYLAKGELQGKSLPQWKKESSVLKGTGFNYDFEDSEGGSRDLRTGELIKGTVKNHLPLLQVNDTLVTTGMDGVFPADFTVGKVTKITPLKEGDYYYELEAYPTAGNLEELSLLFVLPPLGYDIKETK